MRPILVAVVALALTGCPHPSPTPVTPPGPAPTFVCDAAIPDDQLNNDIVNAAQILDDADSFAALDALTAGGRIDVVRCRCAAILPDLRNAAVTGVHLAAWLANHGGTP